MPEDTFIQRGTGSGRFIGSTDAARIGNEALEKGFSLVQAAFVARKKTGHSPGIYKVFSESNRSSRQSTPDITPASYPIQPKSPNTSAREAYRTARNSGCTVKEAQKIQIRAFMDAKKLEF